MGQQPQQERRYDREAAWVYAVEIYAQQTHYGGISAVSHAERVADKAEQLYTAWCRQTDPWLTGATQTTIDAVWCGGLLHEAIDRGGQNYEMIAWRISPEIADYVAAVSYDPRYPLPRRLAERTSAVGAAPWPAQVIGLADLWVELEARALDAARRPRNTFDNREMEIWLSKMHDLYLVLRPALAGCEVLEATGRRLGQLFRGFHRAEEEVRRMAGLSSKLGERSTGPLPKGRSPALVRGSPVS